VNYNHNSSITIGIRPRIIPNFNLGRKIRRPEIVRERARTSRMIRIAFIYPLYIGDCEITRL
jgi:hypothetical protein